MHPAETVTKAPRELKIKLRKKEGHTPCQQKLGPSRRRRAYISSNMSLGKIALPDHADDPVDEESEISTTAMPTLSIQPTVSPPTVIIPIVSSIIVVPILIGIILCLLREDRTLTLIYLYVAAIVIKGKFALLIHSVSKY